MPETPSPSRSATPPPSTLFRLLDLVERVGNRLPDPAALFVVLLAVVVASSWLLSGSTFSLVDPRSNAPLRTVNLLDGKELAGWWQAG